MHSIGWFDGFFFFVVAILFCFSVCLFYVQFLQLEGFNFSAKRFPTARWLFHFLVFVYIFVSIYALSSAFIFFFCFFPHPLSLFRSHLHRFYLAPRD